MRIYINIYLFDKCELIGTLGICSILKKIYYQCYKMT